MTTKIQKRSWAILAAAPANPPNPNKAAMMAATRKIKAHRNMFIYLLSVYISASSSAACRLRSGSTAVAAPAEKTAEQVPEQVIQVHPALEPAGHPLDPGVAVAVVTGPLLGVGQDLERLGRFLELVRCLGVAVVAVV